MAAAHEVAHRLACEEWNARQFIGGDADASPTIAAAIKACVTLLEVKCQTCGRSEYVYLPDLVRPSDKPIHTLGKVRILSAEWPSAPLRPNLVALCADRA